MSQYTVSRLVKETGKTEEEVRYCLLDSYPNPDTVEEISAADYEAVFAALTSKGGSLELKQATNIQEQRSQMAIVEIAGEMLDLRINALFTVDLIATEEAIKAQDRALEQMYAEADIRRAKKIEARTARKVENYSALIEKINHWIDPDLAEEITKLQETEGNQLNSLREVAKESEDFFHKVSRMPA